MQANDLIESYVDDVGRRLPRKLRNDVGLELSALLGEEPQARANEAGRAADTAKALALLGAFGRPAEVADRYRPTSLVIIRPSGTNGFALTALIGVAAARTDAITKSLILLTVLLSLLGLAGALYRELARVHRPSGLAALRG